MTVTPERPHPLDARPDPAPVDPALVEPSAPRSGPWARRREPIDGRWAAAVGGAWAVMFVVEPLLVPAPADDAPTPWWDVVLGLGILVVMGVVLVGCLTRRRLGAQASALGVAVTIPLVVACPVSGHHAFAAWWAVDLALWLAVGVLTLEALRAPAPPEPPRPAPAG